MALIEDNSILMSIKKLLNVDETDQAFDMDIGMAINAEFMTLHQLGIGPEEGFYVNDADTKWADFSDDQTLINTVKQYIFCKVRMIFDPPASSIVADAYNNRIHELEFRLNVQAEREESKAYLEAASAERNQNNFTVPEEEEIIEEISKPQTPVITNTATVPAAPVVTVPNVSNSNYDIQGETLQLFGRLF